MLQDDSGSSYGESTRPPCLFCTIVVPMLPKGALVEWHVVANKDKDQFKCKWDVKVFFSTINQFVVVVLLKKCCLTKAKC